jgi:hypothetical protein
VTKVAAGRLSDSVGRNVSEDMRDSVLHSNYPRFLA